MNSACIHFYHGDGKGKTTAAVGLAVRALGSGLSVLFAQFLKGPLSGEVVPLSKLGADVRCCGGGKFVCERSESELDELRKQLAVFFAQIERDSPAFDVVVLDEAGDAAALGLIDPQRLTQLARALRGAGTETVVTGHKPLPVLCECADYITEMSARRHPYTSGAAARRGIEF